MGPKKKDSHRHSPPPGRGDSTKTMADNEETSTQGTGSSSSVDDDNYRYMAHFLYALHKIAKHQRDDRDRESIYWQQRYDRSEQRRRELALQLATERQRSANFLRRNRLLRRTKQRSKRPPISTNDSSSDTSFATPPIGTNDASSDTPFATPPQRWQTSNGEFAEKEVSAKGRPLPPLPTIDKSRATPPSDTSYKSAQNGLPPASPPHDLKASVVEPRFDSTTHASVGSSRLAQKSTRNKPDDPSKDDEASNMQNATTGMQTSSVSVSHSPSSMDTSSGSEYRRIYEFVQQVADAPRPPPHQHYRRVSMSEMASDILAASVLPRHKPSHVMPPEATSPIPSQPQASSHKRTMSPEPTSPTLAMESRSTQTSLHRPTQTDISTRRPSTYMPAAEYTTRTTQTDVSKHRPSRCRPITEYTTRATQTDSTDRPNRYTPTTEYTTRATQTDPFSPRMSPKQPNEFNLDINTQLNILQDEITHRQFMQP